MREKISGRRGGGCCSKSRLWGDGVCRPLGRGGSLNPLPRTCMVNIYGRKQIIIVTFNPLRSLFILVLFLIHRPNALWKKIRAATSRSYNQQELEEYLSQKWEIKKSWKQICNPILDRLKSRHGISIVLTIEIPTILSEIYFKLVTVKRRKL